MTTITSGLTPVRNQRFDPGKVLLNPKPSCRRAFSLPGLLIKGVGFQGSPPLGRGILHMDYEVKKQVGVVVMTFTAIHPLRRRPAE